MEPNLATRHWIGGVFVRIRSIHASNFLSFGHTDNGQGDFCLNDLDETVTILVGPNGSGKTNVLRAVRYLVELLPEDLRPRASQEDVASEVRRLFHRPTGEREPMVLELSVEFDHDEEKRALSLAWGLAIALNAPDQDSLNRQVRIEDWAVLALDAVQRALDSGSMADWLFRGRLAARLEPANSAESVPWSLWFKLDSVPAELDLLGLRGGVDLIAAGGIEGGGRSMKPSTLYISSLNQAEKDSLIQKLETEDSPASDASLLPRFFRQPRLEASGGGITTRFQKPDRYPNDPDFGDRLIRELLNLIGERKWSGSCSLSKVVSRLVSRAIVLVDHWESVGSENIVDSDDSDELLRRGRLAAHLFALKNGTSSQRVRFVEIQKEFETLTRRKMDVVFKPSTGAQRPTVSTPSDGGPEIRIPLKGDTRIIYEGTEEQPYLSGRASPQSETEYKVKVVPEPWKFAPRVEIVIQLQDWDIPASDAGSGIMQAIYWVATMKAPARQVLILDEPDLHFHPSLASRAATRLITNGLGAPQSPAGPTCLAQVILVSHSPWSVPDGELRRVRRIGMECGRSAASPKMNCCDERRLLASKRTKTPDERMFLYSRVTVFVEGPHDACAVKAWFDRWCKLDNKDNDASDELGIHFQQCGGKHGVAPLLATALFFKVPAIGLWDVDVLKPDREEDRQVVAAWRTHQLVDAALLENGGPLYDDHGNRRRATTEIVNEFPSGCVFLLGNWDDNKLESLPLPDTVRDGLRSERASTTRTMKHAAGKFEGDHGVLAYRLVAEKEPDDDQLLKWLSEYGLIKLFEKVCELASV